MGQIWQKTSEILNEEMSTLEYTRNLQHLLTKKRPLSVSRRCLSTALWVALLSAVFARLLGFLLPAAVWEVMVELRSALTLGRESVIGGGVNGEGG